jgi:hypothetical protein
MTDRGGNSGGTMMRRKKERYGGLGNGRPQLVEGLEARTLLSTAAAAADPAGVVVPPMIALEAASSAPTTQGIDETVRFEPGDRTRLAAAGVAALSLVSPAEFGDFDPFGGTGLAAVSPGHFLRNVSYDGSPLTGFSTDTFFGYGGAGEGLVFGGTSYPAGAAVVAILGKGTVPLPERVVVTSPPSATVMTIPLEAKGVVSQPQVPQPQPSEAIASLASGAGAANVRADSTRSRGPAAASSVGASRVGAGMLPAVERAAGKAARPTSDLGVAETAAQEVGIASRLQALSLIADGMGSASAGAVSAVTASASQHPGATGGSFAPLSGLVGIALPTVGNNALFSDTPLKLVEPAMTTLPGLLLGLAPGPAAADRAEDTGRGWEIAAAASLGVAVAGYWYASRAERDAREAAVDRAGGVRRICDGWELVPMEPR